MDVKSIREKFPQYDDLSDEALVDGLHSAYYSDMPVEDFYKSVGFKPQKVEIPPVQTAPQKAGFSPKDTALALGQGIVGAGKSLTDVFGADNAVSNYLGNISSGMGQAYTPGRQAEMQERAKLQTEASKSGDIVKEINAFLGGVAEAPVQALAQGLGSIAPYVATRIAGQIGRLGSETVRAINTVVGAAQGAGAVKGSIYDSVKDELIANGMAEKEAKVKASKAQEYIGSNFLDIAGGAALGAAGARYGVENLLTPGMTSKLDAKLLPRVGKAILAEAPLEGLQGGQEQLAINRALIDEGFKRDAMEGVFGATIRDAVIGAMTAGVVGVPGPGKKFTPREEIKASSVETPAPPSIEKEPTPASSMFDEQGNLITSRQVTPEDLAAMQAAKAEEFKKDEAGMLGGVNFKMPTQEAIEPVAPKFEGLTPEAQKLVDIASLGAAPPSEITPAKIKQIAEDNLIPWQNASGAVLTYEELIGELNAKAGAPNGPVDTETSGTSAEVLGERGTVPTERAGEPNGSGVVDTGSDVVTTDGGERNQQPTLAKEVKPELSAEEQAALQDELAAELAAEEAPKATKAQEKAIAATSKKPRKVRTNRTKEQQNQTTQAIRQEQFATESIILTDDTLTKEEKEDEIAAAAYFIAADYDNKAALRLLAADLALKTKENEFTKSTGGKYAEHFLRALSPEDHAFVVLERKRLENRYKAADKALNAKEDQLQSYIDANKTPEQLAQDQAREAKLAEQELGTEADMQGELKGKVTDKLVSSIIRGDLRSALQEMATNKDGTFSALDSMVAKRLLNAKSLPEIKVVSEQDLGGSRGRYDAATDVAYIGENSIDSHSVLHEALHGFTLAIIKAHKEGLINNMGVKNLDELYEHLKANYPDLVKEYGMKNLTEFAAEVMSNEAFQNRLNEIPYKKQNAFTAFARAILQLLGISPTDNFTALASALISTESILTEGRTLEETNPPPATAALAPSDVTGLKPTEPQKQHSKVEFDDYVKNLSSHLDEKLGTPTHEKIKQTLTTKEGGRSLVRMFQNRREILRRIYLSLERQGKLVTTGKDINNVAAQFDTAAAIADDKDRQYNRQIRDKMIETIGNYTKDAGISEHEALTNLQVYFEVNHEPERRQVKYLTTVPLSHDPTLFYLGKQVSPADRRRQILDFLNNYREDNEAKRHEVVKTLRKELDDIVGNKANLDASKKTMLDINDPRYNVIAGLSPEKIASFKAQLLAKPEVKNHLDKFEDISAKLQEMNKNNIELNKQGNFWTQPVDNWATFYDFKNYVPFKGKPDTEVEDSKYDPSKKMLVGLQEGVTAMEGRESQADNPVIQVMIDTVNAARRAGYKDVTLSIKNAVDQGYLTGNTKDVIKFDNNRAENIKKERGQNKIFHYEPNGDITVIELLNREQREAIRNTFREDHPFVNVLDSITSFIGQTHTRYNPAFAPVNFTGDLMTNIFTMGAEFGPATSGQLLKNIAAIVGTGGLYKAGKVAVLYNKSGTKELRKYTYKNSSDYDPFYADLVEYLERGGKVSFMQAFDTQSNTSKAIETIKRGGKQTTKEQVDGVIDTWGNMFEFASRAASYKTAKEIYLKQNQDRNMPKAEAEEDAKTRATYYAKNLANFEQVGDYGKVFGAFYMFARPAATGAVRAIEALTPLVRVVFGGERFDTTTPEGAALAAQAKSGAVMFLALLGLGAAAYTMAGMMSDDDDEGRNRTATDDMDRWQKYMRFHVPKYLVGGRDDVILQMRWGYGLGSFASAGAQLAALANGNSSFKQAGTNILQSGLDSFLPLPVSRISIFDNTAAWFLDTATPSAFRPFLEYTMNLDGLGREIYNNRQSHIGDAYTGGDNIPEMYKSAARTLFDITDGGLDWSPNTMYFFANNGADGLFRVAGGAYNLGLIGAGEKAFNPKTDTILFDSFFGSKSNFDARQFSNIEKQIKEVDKQIKTLEADPERLVKYMGDNPNAFAAVEFYNKAVNGDLRELRAEANRIRGDRTYTAKDRKELLDNITQMSNLVKRNMLMNFETLGYTP